MRACESAGMETAGGKRPSLAGFALRRCVLALAYAGLGACLGSGSAHVADGGTGGVRADGNACGSPTCAVTTPTCGIYGDPCGNLVNCGICSFATTTGSVEASGSLSLATTTSGALEVAYARSGGGVNVAHFASGAWTGRAGGC